MTKFEDGIQLIDKTMRRLNVKYAFISGTALGLCRDGKCIEYDSDIDFVVHIKDQPRLDGLEKELGVNVLSRMGKEVIGYGFGVDNQEWIELDFLHNYKNTVWHAWQEGHEWRANVYPKRMWDNLEFIHAYGVKCPVFHPIEEYLELT